VGKATTAGRAEQTNDPAYPSIVRSSIALLFHPENPNRLTEGRKDHEDSAINNPFCALCVKKPGCIGSKKKAVFFVWNSGGGTRSPLRVGSMTIETA
jgi:hypothetical protein